jgi:hypothetical protein
LILTLAQRLAGARLNLMPTRVGRGHGLRAIEARANRMLGPHARAAGTALLLAGLAGRVTPTGTTGLAGTTH